MCGSGRSGEPWLYLMLKGSCLVPIDRQVPDSVSVAEALYQISVEQTKPKVKLEISIEYPDNSDGLLGALLSMCWINAN